MVSRVTGVLRDTAIGAALGTAVLGDTFAVANTIPNTIYAMLAGGAISAVFVPQLVRHLKEDADGGDVVHAAAADPRDAVAARASPSSPSARTVRRPAVRDADVDRAGLQRLDAVRRLLPAADPVLRAVHDVPAGAERARALRRADVRADPQQRRRDRDVRLFFVVVGGDALTTSTITNGEILLLGVGTTLGIALQALVLVPVMRRTGFRWQAALRLPQRRARPRRRRSRSGRSSTSRRARSRSSSSCGSRRRANTLGTDGGANVGFASYQRANLIFQLPQSVITLSVVTALLPALSAHAIGGDLRRLADDLLVRHAARARRHRPGDRRAARPRAADLPRAVRLRQGDAGRRDGDRPRHAVVRPRPDPVHRVLRADPRLLRARGHPDAGAGQPRAQRRSTSCSRSPSSPLVSDAHKVQALAATYLPTYAFAAVVDLGAAAPPDRRRCAATTPSAPSCGSSSRCSPRRCSCGSRPTRGDRRAGRRPRSARWSASSLALALGGGVFLLIARRIRVDRGRRRSTAMVARPGRPLTGLAAPRRAAAPGRRPDGAARSRWPLRHADLTSCAETSGAVVIGVDHPDRRCASP